MRAVSFLPLTIFKPRRFDTQKRRSNNKCHYYYLQLPLAIRGERERGGG